MFQKFFDFLIYLSDDLALVDAIQDQVSFQEIFPPGNLKIEIAKMLLSLFFFADDVWDRCVGL